MDDFVRKIFDEDDDVLVVQVYHENGHVKIARSTLETMPTDTIIHGARVFIRSVHYERTIN